MSLSVSESVRAFLLLEHERVLEHERQYERERESERHREHEHEQRMNVRK